MKIKVLYFASLKDLFGTQEELVELHTGGTLADLAQQLILRRPEFSSRIASLAWGVNFEYASPQDRLRDGDEVALLPPVSGGGND